MLVSNSQKIAIQSVSFTQFTLPALFFRASIQKSLTSWQTELRVYLLFFNQLGYGFKIPNQKNTRNA
jgi:hypothetical protein